MTTITAVQTTHEILVHLGSFLNVDLFSRGVFFVRVCILSGSTDSSADTELAESARKETAEQSQQHALPYAHKAGEQSNYTTVGDTKLAAPDLAALASPTVEGPHYHTRMFIVRYKEELVTLNEVVQFQHVASPAAASGSELISGLSMVSLMMILRI